MSIPDRILLVHKGALGDFLQTWPSIYALRNDWPEKTVVWAGRSAYRSWLEPLDIEAASPEEVRAVDRLSSASAWPGPLKNRLIIWFGLLRPPTALPFKNLWFLAGLEPQGWRSPRDVYLQALAARGIRPNASWPAAWRRLVACQAQPRQREPRALIFPGAGHPAKCWPLENYLRLARHLETRGLRVGFVFGPAELERGLEVKNFERHCPKDLQELTRLLTESDLVIGNDSGPLHLSAVSGIPSLVLFGPTSPQQWGPWGARTISPELDCAPCSRMGRIDCPEPVCLQRLPTDRVTEAADAMIDSALQR